MKPKSISTPQVLLWVTILSSMAVFIFMKPIGQDMHYHFFSNDRALLGINNCWNVLSNIGFVITGLLGIKFLRQHNINNSIIWVLFAGIVLTGFGSSYYHFNPNNSSLVWDRLPMTIVFNSFFAIIYTWCFSPTVGFKVWLISIAVGIYAVFYWQYTEQAYRGDLRLYAIVQFLPIVLIVVILASNYKKHTFLIKPIAMIMVWYIIAKLLEHFDAAIFEITSIISEHPLKHIAAAVATYYIYKMIKVQYETMEMKS